MGAMVGLPADQGSVAAILVVLAEPSRPTEISVAEPAARLETSTDIVYD